MKSIFTIDDQRDFARLSGDTNPMHLDAMSARRTQAAEPVVHGIHGLLNVLEDAELSADDMGSGLKVRFENFLYLGQDVTLRRAERGNAKVVELVAGGRIVTSVFLDAAGATIEVEKSIPVTLPDHPIDLTTEEVQGKAGAFLLAGTPGDYEQRFPKLAGQIGADVVRAIAGLSSLVGMLVPGLHSIFSRCEIAFVHRPRGNAGIDAIHYKVVRFNSLLKSVTILFEGGGICGKIDAFIRNRPMKQPALQELAGRNAKSDFEGRRALVIGGSRGLGEMTAKLLALRGASVCVTYLRGKDDAEGLVEELRAAGYEASAVHFDSGAPDRGLIDASSFTDVFYYPTPPIFARRQTSYDPVAADRFMTTYCHHFALLMELLSSTDRRLSVFWPSSTALDVYVPGLAEYTQAKAAGEKLCEILPEQLPGLDIFVRRLPRLDTDQTLSVIPVRSESAEVVVGAVLDEMVIRKVSATSQNPGPGSGKFRTVHRA